ncbi:hypothetical protein HELRODRAFT_178098 [Helobdella robusta]|uniref:Uncharacterized protein n=1 Tax=Helobdella robusta TaxID=6412 RepID=T1FCQ6_HELRO|nr:hypothetical protein HELRODRAFT_178098 [Helobdella robusta]ESN97313.1 hypothetical protein HELRODRAFT_178098 [Helobdella robusta]
MLVTKELNVLQTYIVNNCEKQTCKTDKIKRNMRQCDIGSAHSLYYLVTPRHKNKIISPEVSISEKFDRTLQKGFENILNISLDDKAAATVSIQDMLLPTDKAYVDDVRTKVYVGWGAAFGRDVDINIVLQKEWHVSSVNRLIDRISLLTNLICDEARITAVLIEWMVESGPEQRLWYQNG